MHFYTINVPSFVMTDDNIYLFIFSFKQLRYNKHIYTCEQVIYATATVKFFLTHCYNHAI